MQLHSDGRLAGFERSRRGNTYQSAFMKETPSGPSKYTEHFIVGRLVIPAGHSFDQEPLQEPLWNLRGDHRSSL